MLFGSLAHADVADRRRHQRSLGAFQWAQHDLDRKCTSIFPPCNQLDSRPDLLCQRLRCASCSVGYQPFGKAFRNDVLHFLPDELIALVAELLLGLHVQQHDLSGRVHYNHGIRRRLQEPAVSAFHLRQMLFGSSAHADIADRRRHECPLGTFQRAQHDLDRKLGSILALGNKLDPGSDLLRERFRRTSRAVRYEPLGKSLRNNVLHLLPDQFIAAVSELLLRLHIQKNDLPTLVHHYHGVGRRFEQSAVPALHLRQMLFGGLAHADVADRRRHQRSFHTFQRAQHDLDRKLGSILAPCDELDSCSDLLRQRFGRASRTVRDQPFGKAFRNDVLHFLSDELIAAVSKLLFCLHVQQHNLPTLVHYHHGIRSRFEQSAVPALHLCQMLFGGLAHADVADRRRHERSFRTFQRAQHDLDRKLGSILALGNKLDPGSDLLRQRLCRTSRAVRYEPLGKSLRNNVFHLLPDQFIAAVSELLLRLHIQKNDLTVLVHHHHSVRRRFEQSAVPALHLRQMLLGGLAHADVADRRRHERSFHTLERAQHDLDRKLGSILALGNKLDPGSDLLRQRFRRASCFICYEPLGKSLRNNVLHLLPDQFIAAVSELLLRLHIQKNDLTVLVHHYHGIGRRFEQSAVPALHLCQMLLGSLAHADVADRRRHERSFRTFQRAQHDLDRKLGSILALGNKLDPGSDLLRQRLCRTSRAVRYEPLGKSLRNNVFYLLPDQFIAAVSELLLRLHIQKNDLPTLVHHYHGVGRRFEQSAVPALHLRQMLLGGLAHADVADRRRHQRSFRTFQRAQHDLDRKLGSILALGNKLDPGSDLLRQRFRRASCFICYEPLGKSLRNNVLHLLPDQFIAAVSELLLRLHIQKNDLTVLVHHYHGIGRRFEQSAVPALHLCQMLLGSLAHADVADRRRHECSFRTFQRAQHDLDRKLGSILALGNKLDPGSDLLRQRLCRTSRAVRYEPLGKSLRNNVFYLLPDQFIAAVSELLLRLHIQKNDLPTLVHHYHGVGRRFEQSAVPALHLRQMLFGGLAHADVADRCRHQRSFHTFQRAQHDLDRKLGSILAPCDELDSCSDLLRQRFRRASRTVRDQPFGKAFRNDVLHFLSDELIAAVSKLFFCLHVQKHNLPTLVHYHHGIRRRFEQSAVPALHLCQMLFGGLAHADVADRRRHERSFRAFQRAQHDLDRKLGSILALGNKLDPGSDLLRQRLCRTSRAVRYEPLGKSLRNNVFHLLPDQFIAAVSELLLRLHIQENDLPTLVHHYHGIGRRFEQSAVPALHLRQMLFGSLAYADVANCRRHERAFGAVERTQHDLDGKLGSIPSPCNELDPRSDLLGQRFGRASRTVRDQPFRETLRNDVLHFLPDKFIAAVSKLLLRLHIQKNDLTVLVHHHHSVRRRFEQSAVLSIRLCALAEIAADDGKSAQISGEVARRRVGGSHEKAPAVFPHAHPLFFIRAACRCHPKDFCWPASLDIFWRKKTGKVLTGDLFELATSHSFSTGIPTSNFAFGTQHQYGVVLDPLNEPPVLLFAVAERYLGEPAGEAVAVGAPAR